MPADLLVGGGGGQEPRHLALDQEGLLPGELHAHPPQRGLPVLLRALGRDCRRLVQLAQRLLPALPGRVEVGDDEADAQLLGGQLARVQVGGQRRLLELEVAVGVAQPDVEDEVLRVAPGQLLELFGGAPGVPAHHDLQPEHVARHQDVRVGDERGLQDGDRLQGPVLVERGGGGAELRAQLRPVLGEGLHLATGGARAVVLLPGLRVGERLVRLDVAGSRRRASPAGTAAPA